MTGGSPPPHADQIVRQQARQAYAAGRIADALAVQDALEHPAAEDLLFRSLLLHASGQSAAAAQVLHHAAALYPNNPAVHENLAVLALTAGDPQQALQSCQAAADRGSDSPNLLDLLCETHIALGCPDRAVAAGRAALEAKDRRFGAQPPLFTLPTQAPPPFAADQPTANIIAYTVWGKSPRYTVPLQENARILPHLFPGWTMRVYHAADVDPPVLANLSALGVQLQPMALPPHAPPHRALLWRFQVAADPAVHRFLVRDADSLLTVKERVAVDDWVRSGRHFHAMRDWYTHTDLLLAGMWGGVGGIIPAPDTLLAAFTGWRIETAHIDQDLLTQTVWPAVRNSILIHDSIFQPCLGSVPFPPYGALPPGHHIGQNAFQHFSKTG